VKGLPDLSFYPESYLAENAMQNPVAFGQHHKQEIAELVDIADLSLVPFEQAKPALLAAIASGDPMKRYWAAMTCTAFAADAEEIMANVKPLLKDDALIVRMRAAEFLGRIGKINPQTTLIQIVNTTQNSVEATEALNSVVWFRDFFNDKYPVKRSDFNPVSDGADVDDRLNYINGIPYPPKGAKGKARKQRTTKSKKP
ncbi:MAG: HEAT repeat domain-containing protein, partial [Rubripirellula sp.]|nr:HEAT repeat domain-containing protein [Rubripirellula sp.]